jgi:hypothetical protein
MNEEIYIGCKDTQTDEQKARNYKFAEVVSAPAPVNWVEKGKDDWIKYPTRNQDGSLQCVCMTLASEMGIIAKQKYGIWIDFSSSFPYQQRKYKEYGGCSSEDIYEIFPKLGNVFESIMPSQNMSEPACMSVLKLPYYADLAKVFIIKRISLPIDFETIASTIQTTGKGVMAWFWFTSSEWSKEIPTISNPGLNFNDASHHSTTFTDFGLIGNKKYLKLIDSAHFGNLDERWISEEMFSRCYLASYLLTFKMLEQAQPVKPRYIERSVSSAKDCFKWEALFPSNVESNNIADNIYLTAVKAFQKRYNLVSDGIVGPITRSKLLEIYY